MNDFLKRRLEANRKLLDEQAAQTAQEIALPVLPEPKLDLIGNMHRVMHNAARVELEQVPRQTLVKMFKTTKLEEEFRFKVELGCGGNYVQAMRQVLARVRKRVKDNPQVELEDFRLFELSIESKDDHDEVVLLRSAIMTQKDKSIYEDLIDLMAMTKAK